MATRTAKWVALAGLLPATAILAPFFVYGIVAMLIVLGAELAHPDAGNRLSAVRSFGGLILLMAAPLAGMAVAAASLLLGPEVFRHTRSRQVVACCLLLLGIGIGGWWLYYLVKLNRDAGNFGIYFAGVWLVLVFLPMLVGAREFFRILCNRQQDSG
jgi:uncharacterized membrane protein (UPF0136 family)